MENKNSQCPPNYFTEKEQSFFFRLQHIFYVDLLHHIQSHESALYINVNEPSHIPGSHILNFENPHIFKFLMF